MEKPSDDTFLNYDQNIKTSQGQHFFHTEAGIFGERMR